MPPPPAGLAAPEQHAAAAPTHVGTAGGAGSSRNAGVAGAVGGAGSTAGVTAAQQPVVRQLLCSEEQLAALSGTTAPGQNTCEHCWNRPVSSACDLHVCNNVLVPDACWLAPCECNWLQ